MSFDELCDWIKKENGRDPRNFIELSTGVFGRGLFAKCDIPASTTLIDIPAQCLMNFNSLTSCWPRQWLELGATRLLSLHLALQSFRNRNGVEGGKFDFWLPFIQSLPTEFSTIPLTWRSTALEISFSSVLPQSIQHLASAVLIRYEMDFKITSEFWKSRRNELGDVGELVEEDYLIAWLNVNSRCIFFDVGARENNLTLGPVLDMMNHSQNRFTKPLQKSDSLSFSSPSSDSPDPPIRKGDELVFSYGGHEDSLLFAEYGFSLGEINNYNFLPINATISALFRGLEGEEKKKILAEKGYWGDFTMATYPIPASVSFRVLVALRFLHLEINIDQLKNYDSQALDPFFKLLNGKIDEISEENEILVKDSIREICKVERCIILEGISRVEKERDTFSKEKKQDERWEMILQSWKVERWIVENVVAALDLI